MHVRVRRRHPAQREVRLRRDWAWRRRAV